MMILRSVDLPRPLAPMIATFSPRRTVSDTLRSTDLSPYDLEAPATSSTSRPLARSGVKRKSGARRELAFTSATSMRSICFRRLCACLALVALAPKRSTKARLSAMIFSARATSASSRSRAPSFSTQNEA